MNNYSLNKNHSFEEHPLSHLTNYDKGKRATTAEVLVANRANGLRIFECALQIAAIESHASYRRKEDYYGAIRFPARLKPTTLYELY